MHTAAVQLFLAEEEVARHDDFTYQHASVRAVDDALLQECYKIACDVPELALKLLPFAALSAALTLRSSENEAAVAKAVAEGLTRYTLRSGGRATMAALSMLEKLRQACEELTGACGDVKPQVLLGFFFIMSEGVSTLAVKSHQLGLRP